MTIAVPIHRALSTKLAPRSFNVVTRWGYNPWIARVNPTSNNDNDATTSQICLRSKSRITIGTRSYATSAAAKPAGRPKAHTGRTPAKRSSKASTSSKPGPKTAAGKKAVGRKPKAKTARATPRSKTKKPAKKPAAKKAPSKTALLAQRRVKQKELKQKALLDPPKDLPQTAWAVLFSESQAAARGTNHQVGTVAKEAAQKLKNLVPEEKEHYNHIANQNKAANQNAHKKWLATFTPQQIREANNARAQLTRQWKSTHPKLKSVRKFSPLRDDRLVLNRRNAYVFFNKDRHASGDFAHMTVAEASKLVGREWKALDAAGRKKYDEEAAADAKRYIEEYTSVYGQAPATPKSATKA